MELLKIGSQIFSTKDYYCAREDGVYIPKKNGKLWLYVNLTNLCNAHCPFCVNPAVWKGSQTVDPARFRETLEEISSCVDGVSITGGEPMLFPELVDGVAGAVNEILGPDIRLEMATNGTNLAKIPELTFLERFTSIHISRHRADDAGNAALLGFSAPSVTEIRDLVASLKDPGKIVFNCVLQKGGVETLADAAAYLEMAAEAGVQNTGFVGLFLANDYCRTHYVSPGELAFEKDDRFCLWGQLRDHGYCRCGSGDYRAETGFVRFYFRCPGSEKAPYARQLVYNHDNRLLDGFGGEEILL